MFATHPLAGFALNATEISHIAAAKATRLLSPWVEKRATGHRSHNSFLRSLKLVPKRFVKYPIPIECYPKLTESFLLNLLDALT